MINRLSKLFYDLLSTVRLWPFALGLACILTDLPARAQAPDSWVRRTVRKMLTDSTSPGQLSIRFYPTLGYAPETSVELGLSSMLLYQAKNDTLNRLSEVTAFTFFTLESQYGIWLDNFIYGDKDKWALIGRTRFQRFPLLYYGEGPQTSGKNPAVVDAMYVQARQRFLKRIAPNLFIGPQADFQFLYNTSFGQPQDGPHYPLPLGSAGSINLGLGLSLVYDQRHNALNVRKGLFSELSFLSYRKGAGSDYSFDGITIDTRIYRPVNRRNVLAGQLFGSFLRGTVPFNMKSLLGGDMIMRGYYQGRFRDNNLVAAQLEYRMLPFGFSKRVGGTIFAAAGAVAPKPVELIPRRFVVSGGVGLRYLMFPKKDIFIRGDIGVTREGVGFYIITGEAF
nr:BamA/TamA family outer membrane protein [uncultured Arsenicibacter sp.]